jgi:hypothetical protein
MPISSLQWEPRKTQAEVFEEARKKTESRKKADSKKKAESKKKESAAPEPRRSQRGYKPTAQALQNIVDQAESNRGRKVAPKEPEAKKSSSKASSDRKAKTKSSREKQQKRQKFEPYDGPGAQFKGYECKTKSCSGHRAGYAWMDTDQGLPKSMAGTSFYEGAQAKQKGLGMRRKGMGLSRYMGGCIKCTGTSCKCVMGH